MSAGDEPRGKGQPKHPEKPGVADGRPETTARARRQPPVIEGEFAPVAAPSTDGADVKTANGIPGPTETSPQDSTAATAAIPEVDVTKTSAKQTIPEPDLIQAAVSAPVATPERRGTGMALIIAGLVGGIAGAAATLALPRIFPQLLPDIGNTARLEQRLAQIETTLAPKQVVEALDAKLTALTRAQTETGAMAKRVSDVLASTPASSDPASLATMTSRIARAESQAEQLAKDATARSNRQDESAAQLASLTQRLAALEDKARSAAPPSASALGGARLVLSERIARSLQDGHPFAADLKALAATAIPAERLAALQAVAVQGAASRQALQAEFRLLRTTLEHDTATQSATLGERALKMLGGVVSVRPLGEQAGTSPAALTSRIDSGLSAGDFVAAATAWKQLPEPARRASEAFGTRLAARAAADIAIRQTGDEAVASLGNAR